METASSASEGVDVLLKDPFLDYVNDILMEEGMDDDATYAQLVNDTSYQAILSSFQEILGEQLPPISQVDSPAAKFYRCMGEQEKGTPPSANYLPLAEVDLPFEDLKLNDIYTDLYIGRQSSSGRDSKHIKVGKKSTTSSEQVFVDAKHVLVECAKAVAIGDARKASGILQELHQVYGASADGTGLQRIAYFFGEALALRLRGMGEHYYRALCRNMPSAVTMLKTSKFGYEVSPTVKLMHYFANQSILRAAEGAARLHVVEFGLLYGMQWPCLMNALADRKGGPPLLVITGVESPRAGTHPAERLKASGQRLAAYAKTHNVPFQFHAVVTDKWEDVDAASLHIREGEFVVVNCVKCLRHLADESASLPLTISPRQKFLTCMRSLNPHLLLTAVVNAGFSSPFFVLCFCDALYHFSNLFDMLEVLWGDNPERLILERSCFYRDIVNIVACEGAARVERAETYKQWHARIMKAGFRQLPVPPTILSRSRAHVKQHHHKDFFIDHDADGWMLMGWRSRARMAISAWKPSFVRT